jgi:lysophospholipase L1-like esterase
VRDSDGVHLNISGTAIMAQLLAPAIQEALAQTDPSRDA